MEELLHTVYAAGLLVAEAARSHVNPPHIGAVDPQAMKFAVVPRLNSKAPKEPKALKSQVSKLPKPSLAETPTKKAPSMNKMIVESSGPQVSTQSHLPFYPETPETEKSSNRLLTRIAERDPGRQVSSQGCSR